MINLDRFWADVDSRVRGVTEKQIQNWERRHGVTLPAILRQALQRQNGGLVRYTEIGINGLSEIESPDEALWARAFAELEEFSDRRLVFQLAWSDVGGLYLLNYNGAGPAGEPSLHLYYSDPGETTKVGKSLEKFLKGEMKADNAPQVDWTETAKLKVVAEATLDLSKLYDHPCTLKQVLGRQGKKLVLFTHEKSPHEESISKTTLPEPLDAAEGSATISSFRPSKPGAEGTLTLHLEPKKTSGIVHVESKRTADGLWKNEVLHGVPIYVQFESRDRGKLEQLRRTLFGAKVAARAQEWDEDQERFQDQLSSLSKEEQHATMMQVFLDSMELLKDTEQPDSSEVPPGLAAAMEAVQVKLAKAVEEAQKVVSKGKTDPEIRRLMQKQLKEVKNQADAEDRDDG